VLGPSTRARVASSGVPDGASVLDLAHAGKPLGPHHTRGGVVDNPTTTRRRLLFPRQADATWSSRARRARRRRSKAATSHGKASAPRPSTAPEWPTSRTPERVGLLVSRPCAARLYAALRRPFF